MGGNKIPVSSGEYRILRLMAEKGVSAGEISELARELGIERSTLESISSLLAEKGLAVVEEEVREIYEVTERGLEALREGLPEERLVTLLAKRGGEATLDDVKKELGPLAGIAIGLAVRQGLAKVNRGRLKLLVSLEEARRRLESTRSALEAVSRGDVPGRDLLKSLVKRGLVRKAKVRSRILRLADHPERLLGKVQVEVAKLTSDMIKSGRWRSVVLRRYNVAAEPPRVYPALPHFLAEFIEMLRDIMKEMGFREVEGPMVEYELYNFDTLFQPQDHPAREIHDTLRVPREYGLEKEPPRDLVERVAAVHERGWGYKWSPEAALRLVLRSQTTSVSARILTSKPTAPLRVFTVGRVYRSDVVDATHLPEFHQLDGLDGDYGYTFRDLLGVLKEISERLGFEVKFKPAYFPFTEPSVEGYVRLPNGRWLELFGAGMMRPEVLEMAGVDYPVGAWGFGVERLAAAYYGIADIRKLYTRNIEELRRRIVKWG